METAKQNTQQNIEENDALKQFMGLLNRQGMGEQSQDFMELFQYVAGMQLQLAVMTDELQGVKEQLSQLRENQPKTVTESLVDKVTHLQEKIANLSERLSAVKDHLAETATQAFNAFKEKGKAEMCKVLQKGISGVKSVRADCREHLVDVMMDYKKTANQIDSIGDELKQIGNSVSNVGRLLAGKGTKEASDEKSGVALTRAVNKPVKKAIARLEENLDSIDRMSEKLDKIYSRLEPQKAAEKGTRTSLKEKLAQMQEKAGTQNRQPDMEKKKEKGKEAVI